MTTTTTTTTDRLWDNLYVANDGNWGYAVNMAVINSRNWSAKDWGTFENFSESERNDYRLHILLARNNPTTVLLQRPHYFALAMKWEDNE